MVTPRYMDPMAPLEQRVSELLERMTVEEKVGQLICVCAWQAVKGRDGEMHVAGDVAEVLERTGMGALVWVLRADPWTGVTLQSGFTPVDGARALNALQQAALSRGRLGIPLLFAEECAHGHMSIGGTVFPTEIGLASTWNADLVRQVAAATAAETRAQGGTVAFCPILDVVRDPRWGRTEETFGEDPLLVRRLGVAMVEGFQGTHSGALQGDDTIAATIKHFAGYGSSEGGRNCAPPTSGRASCAKCACLLSRPRSPRAPSASWPPTTRSTAFRRRGTRPC